MEKVILSKYAINADNSSLDINGSIKYDDYQIAHNHDYFEFVVVMEGKYENDLNNVSRIMERGDACLIKPEDVHKMIAKSSRVKHLNLLIKPQLFKKCCNNLSSDLFDVVCKQNNQYFSMSDSIINTILTYQNLLYIEVSENKRELISKLIINSILTTIIEKKDIVGRTLPKFLEDLINEMNKESNLNWTAKQVAEKTHYSQIHLERIFKEYFGVTIIKYMQNNKMAIAIKYLLYSNKTVGEISSLLGYSDVSHFNHIFKEYYKTSPLKFRRDNSKDNYYK